MPDHCAGVIWLAARASGPGAGWRQSPPAAGVRRRPSTPSADLELTIFAAASLKGALEAAQAAYEATNPGANLAISTDSSAALATQIEEGAPADVFLSGDTKNPQALVDKGLADGAAVEFAGNALVVIVPTDNPAGIGRPPTSPTRA